MSYPHTVTRHDLLKTIAILLMVIDHVGLFLFPDQPLLRVIGRCSAPIWLFLVGYNRTDRIDNQLIYAALFMAAMNPILIGFMFPTNILVSIILVRLTLSSMPLLLMPLHGFKRGAVPGLLLVALALAAYPANLLWEYGSFCWLFAALGWWVRERENDASPFSQYPRAPYIFMAVTMIFYATHYALIMPLDWPKVALMALLLAVTGLGLLHFRAGALSWQPLPACAVLLRFCGRQSLLIYIVHVVLLGLYYQITKGIFV